MPELPEVEILVQHLREIIVGRTIRRAKILRAKTCRPQTPGRFQEHVAGRRIQQLHRRAKYLVLTLGRRPGEDTPPHLLAHLGMTGRLFVQTAASPLPTHTAAVLRLDQGVLVFQDTRFFGRLTFDTTPLGHLGPEPLSPDFTTCVLADALRPSRQAVKVRLLDQSTVAGLGNIYASEALFGARIHPARPARELRADEIAALRRTIRSVLRGAISFGSTVPLSWDGAAKTDRLFYYGRHPDAPARYEERLRVYDREGQPCTRRRCQGYVQRIVQAARSTFYCPICQPHRS